MYSQAKNFDNSQPHEAAVTQKLFFLLTFYSGEEDYGEKTMTMPELILLGLILEPSF